MRVLFSYDVLFSRIMNWFKLHETLQSRVFSFGPNPKQLGTELLRACGPNCSLMARALAKFKRHHNSKYLSSVWPEKAPRRAPSQHTSPVKT